MLFKWCLQVGTQAMSSQLSGCLNGGQVFDHGVVQARKEER